MPQIINTNIASLNAQRNLDKSQSSNQQALQRLSSGLRINSAKDDAAGMAISTRFTSQIKGLNVAVRNAGDGIALAQTAEGALGSMNDSLQRIRELAVQSSNATNSDVDRDALQAEVDQLISEISRTADETDFNGRNLLDGSFSASFQVGANAGQTIDVSIAELTADKLGSSASAGISARGTDSGIQNGDLVINGTAITASRAGDDTSSTNNAAASAISKVAAINRASDETGVTAEVLTNVVGGAAQTAAATSGSITLNDVEINVATGGVDVASDRQAVVAAINAKSEQTGVVAVDSESDTSGIRLEAADGRNIELSFGGSVTSAATGLNGGDSGLGGTFEGGFTLNSKLGGEIDVQAGTGSLANTGLVEGSYKGGVASVATAQRTSDSAQVDQQAAVTVTTGTIPDTFAVLAEDITIALDAVGSSPVSAVNGTITLSANSIQTLDGLIADVNEQIAGNSNIAGRVEAVSVDNQMVIRATDDSANESGATSTLTVAGAALNTTTGTLASISAATTTTTAGQDFNSTQATTGSLGQFTAIDATTNGLSIEVIGQDGQKAQGDLTLTANTDIDVALADIKAQIAASATLNGFVDVEKDTAGTGFQFTSSGGEAQGSSSILRLSGTAITGATGLVGIGDGTAAALDSATATSGEGTTELSFYGVDGLDRSTKAQYTSSDGFDMANGEAITTAANDDEITITMETASGQKSITLTNTQGEDSAAEHLITMRDQIAADTDFAGKIDIGFDSADKLRITRIGGDSGGSSALTVSGGYVDSILESAAPVNGSKTVSGVESQLSNEAADALASGDLVLNGSGIRASRAADDTASDTTANSSDAAASGIAVAAAINDSTEQTGVTAMVNKTVVDGGSQTAAADQQGRVVINNVATDVISTTGDADTDRASAISAINSITGQTGVTAVDAGDRIVLEAEDGRNISLAIDTQQSSASGSTSALSGKSIGLDASQNGIAEGDLTGADTFKEVAATSYSSVTLESATKIDMRAGNNGNLELEKAGFEVGEFGGATDGQFLKDVDISTVAGAQEALVAIDNAIGQVASQRADLGAIQNRMESTVSNLQVTSENLNAANSRIQDADFAAETAELQRTNVLQQAGISVLAQANASGQQVLSLLG
ncbi:MAG: flagellin [Oleispira sp.]|jgi:flagellin